MERKINKDDSIVIKITDGHVHIKTVDNLEFPIDIWNFKRDEMNHRDRMFIDNMISMAMTMVSDQNKNKVDKSE